MLEQGSLDGDGNADAIIADRLPAKKSASVLGAVYGVAFLVTAVGYGLTGRPAILAALIVLAVWVINGTVSLHIYDTHTFVMIAERRAQLLEQRLQAVQSDMNLHGRD